MPEARAVKAVDTENTSLLRDEADILAALSEAGFTVYLRGCSAIDSWLGRDAGAELRVLTGASLADLARFFENLRYPGIDIADAALDYASGSGSCYFDCADSEKACNTDRPFPIENHQPSFKLLEFYQDWKTRRFYDPCGIYPLLRQIRKSRSPTPQLTPRSKDSLSENSPLVVLRDGLNPRVERSRALIDGALILAKYFPDVESLLSQEGSPSVEDGHIEQMARLFRSLPEGPAPGEEEQRLLLTGLLTAPNPGLGLELLKSCGFIGEFWPELAVLDDVDQSKEFHPEGNAWKHTLETFRYRKTGLRGAWDLRLSLGLLLHDVGKPLSASTGSRRFNGHAELGERQARRFLERLGFGASLISDVCYLVKNHMLPAALPRLPLIRTGEIMASPLFPTLLELYRCDESSSFKGLDGYYESSAAYQSYLKNRRNPYRSADGKKLNRPFTAG
ncbi:hypothetical protein AGMMS50293_01230 [Spirochaetia bacterium]|nr:hypothetical protein AGMMS50293_01230 [Spirochaetia bacterium]